MKWHVSVFTQSGDRLVWASPCRRDEALALAKEAVREGFKAYVRNPAGEAMEVER